MSSDEHHHDHPRAHEQHASHGAAHGPKRYLQIWVILCVLLAVSVSGPMLNIAIVTLITAFGIAGVKAYLVMKHFMHLDVERPVVHFMLATAVMFMVMFFSAVSIDVQNHEGARWSNDAAKRAVVAGLQAGDPHHRAEGGEAPPHGATAPSGEH